MPIGKVINTTIMKKIIILFLLLLNFSALAQEKKFSFGINFFPNFSQGAISNNGNYSAAKEGYKKMETWKPSISGNLFVAYNINEKSIIGIGLGYQNNGERTNKIDYTFGDYSYTISDPSLPDQRRFIYNHHNVEIPIYYQLNIGSRFYALIGTSAIINITNTVTTHKYYVNDSESISKSEDESTNFRRFNFTGNIGFGLNYLNKEKIKLFVHPYLQIGVLGVSNSAVFNRNIWSVGISTGIKI